MGHKILDSGGVGRKAAQHTKRFGSFDKMLQLSVQSTFECSNDNCIQVKDTPIQRPGGFDHQ